MYDLDSFYFLLILRKEIIGFAKISEFRFSTYLHISDIKDPIFTKWLSVSLSVVVFLICLSACEAIFLALYLKI